MDLKILIPFLLSAFAFMQTQQLITKAKPSGRGRSWRQQTSVRVSLPGSPAALPLSNPTGPSITNEISLGNLNLAPGQSKIIRQTMVIRRPGNPSEKGSGGRGVGSRLRSALSLSSNPQGSVPGNDQRGANNHGQHSSGNPQGSVPGNGQRGANNHGQHSSGNPQGSVPGNGQRGANNHGQHSSGVYLLSKLPPSVAPHLQPSAAGHKTASLTIPVIDLNHHAAPVSGGSSHGAATEGNHNFHPHHASSGHAIPYLNNHNDILGGPSHGNGHGLANNGHGNINGNGNSHQTANGHGNSNHGGPVIVSANDLLNTGVAPIDIARHLLAGNPDIVIVPQGSLEQSRARVSNFGNTVSSANLPNNNNDFNNPNNANNLPGHPISVAGQMRISPKSSNGPFVSINAAVRLNPVHSTTEPGEDPPELPETIQ